MISTVFNSNYEQLISNIVLEMVVSVDEPLSPPGSIFKILGTVGTCDILVYRMRHQIMY